MALEEVRALAHQEIPIKVTAWVDQGIAPLVAALNEFHQVMTLDSCEGDAERGAYVLFRCQEGEPLHFVAELAGALCPHDTTAEFSLRAEWRAGADEPVIELACPPDQIEPLARLVSACQTR